MFDNYINQVNRLYCSGNATEHSYRPALQYCLSTLLKDTQVTNEPKRQKCGAPDYILTRRKIDIGYIEAKDIHIDLDRVERGGKDDNQWERYVTSLDNIILTDYLEFRFFRNGQKVDQIRIANATKRAITPIPENFERLQTLLLDFVAFEGQPIKSAKKLAEMMAHKAALMRDVFFKAVNDKTETETTLRDQLDAFQSVLVHDMDEAQFADVYAQTIAYGLFTARLHDLTPKDFSRSEAITLIPKSNPFLRQLFQYVAGNDLDARVVWIIDALCEVFRYADLTAILKDFGVATGKNDPILHFYETFLAEYDPKLRKSRGVWYTPEPVVRFIVRAIDDVLKSHFGIKDGIADTSKIKIKVDGHAKGKAIKVEEEVHKVQLLDVATGTGTFLAEVVKQIYARFAGQEGMWSDYVDNQLLPRMHGFELLMASYAMCHMKIDLLLQQTGYKPTRAQKRLSVYLTNSLEEHHKDSHLPFANWLSREANEASRIKREIPIMVAFGNPPYSGVSSNMNSWVAKNKIEDYKYVDGVHFNERRHWLNNDYVQFIRLGEHYIEKNGEGVLAFITDNSYIDGPTFRGMRWHLLNTFGDIYVLDLHGNSNKKETAPDGSADKNVFDIQQGVSIIVAIKKRLQKEKKKPLGKVYHADLYGSREGKYEALERGSLKNIAYKEVETREPFYFFIQKNHDNASEYDSFPCINDIFEVIGLGFQSSRDNLVVDFTENGLQEKIERFVSDRFSDEAIRKMFFGDKKVANYLPGDTRQWALSDARVFLRNEKNWRSQIRKTLYRPFDTRYILYNQNMVDWPRPEVLGNMLHNNIAILVNRQSKEEFAVLCSDLITERKIAAVYDASSTIPLYKYPKEADLWGHGGVANKAEPNIKPEYWKKLTDKLKEKVSPEDLFDYIYAVLHSRAYRQRYAEFLKSDFPRIPYPKDKKTFHALAAKGAELRYLHLMEGPVLHKLITAYPVGGDHKVIASRWEPEKSNQALGRVWINPTQYFDKVPYAAWGFYVGGYQPAQKWLKDRKGHNLTSNDIIHWQRIIVALTETNKRMDEIENIDFLPK